MGEEAQSTEPESKPPDLGKFRGQLRKIVEESIFAGYFRDQKDIDKFYDILVSALNYADNEDEFRCEVSRETALNFKLRFDFAVLTRNMLALMKNGLVIEGVEVRKGSLLHKIFSVGR